MCGWPFFVFSLRAALMTLNRVVPIGLRILIELLASPILSHLLLPVVNHIYRARGSLRLPPVILSALFRSLHLQLFDNLQICVQPA